MVNKFYTLQSWLVSIIVVGPILMFLFNHSYHDDLFDIYDLLSLSIVFGLIFSVPTFIVYHAFFKFLTKKLYPSLKIKVALNTVAIIGVFITFQIMNGSRATVGSAIYSGSIIIVSLIFKVYKTKALPPT